MIIKNIRDRYWDVLDKAIEINEENINSLQGLRKEIGDLAFSKEFATVKINIGRQFGSTTYIAKNAKVGDCVICSTITIRDEVKKRHSMWVPHNLEILTLNSLHTPTKNLIKSG